jgi:integrase
VRDALPVAERGTACVRLDTAVAVHERVFRQSVARAGSAVRPGVVFHSLRHKYVSLCVAAGIPPLEISRFADHSTVTTTVGIYAHLFESDHSTRMAALGGV